MAPGPNTKVTTTIKTYTYELPGAPEHYLPAGHTGTDQTVTYKLDKTLERSASPLRYTSTPEINQKSSILHKESKYHQEELRGSPTQGWKSHTPQPSGVSPTDFETTTTTTTKKENYYIKDERYDNSYIPVDRVDYPGYQNGPPYTETTTTTLIDRVEEHYPGDRAPTPPNCYYTTPPPNGSSSVYKYSKESYNSNHLSDREILLPKPFPTGTQLYPVNGKTPSNGRGPPRKLDDLMASFSDSEVCKYCYVYFYGLRKVSLQFRKFILNYGVFYFFFFFLIIFSVKYWWEFRERRRFKRRRGSRTVQLRKRR